MKAVINEKETPVKPKYPYLGKQSSYLVAFTSRDTGVLVSGKNEAVKLYTESEEWEEDDFTPFTGSITLSND